MPGRGFELNGIPLEIPNPRGYLAALFRAMKAIPFYPPSLRQTVADALGEPPPVETGAGEETMATLPLA